MSKVRGPEVEARLRLEFSLCNKSETGTKQYQSVVDKKKIQQEVMSLS